jgi:hypothetical protein
MAGTSFPGAYPIWFSRPPISSSMPIQGRPPASLSGGSQYTDLGGVSSGGGGRDWGQIAKDWGPTAISTLGGALGAWAQSRSAGKDRDEDKRQFDLQFGRSQAQDDLERDRENYRRQNDMQLSPYKLQVLQALLGRLNLGGAGGGAGGAGGLIQSLMGGQGAPTIPQQAPVSPAPTAGAPPMPAPPQGAGGSSMLDDVMRTMKLGPR